MCVPLADETGAVSSADDPCAADILLFRVDIGLYCDCGVPSHGEEIISGDELSNMQADV